MIRRSTSAITAISRASNKDDAREKWGEEQVHIWRRSYNVQPPGGESLRDTVARVLPYYIREIQPRVMRGRARRRLCPWQSLRALSWCSMATRRRRSRLWRSERAVPMVYRLNADTTVASKAVLED